MLARKTTPNPTLNVPQHRFISMPKKFKAFVAGMGTGKTWVGCASLCVHAWEWPRINSGFFAPTYPLIRDVFFPTMEEVAFDWGLRLRIVEGNKEVHYYSGRKYRGTTICRSMSKPENIIGFKIGHAVVDELDTMTNEKALHAWKKILARRRYKVDGLKNGIDVTTTPEGYKATYDLFVKRPAEKERLRDSYGIVHASTYDNAANLNEDYIPELIAAYPEELIQAYLLGQFCNLRSGTVYRAYNRDGCASDEQIQPGDVLRIGMDFNVGKMAATVYVVREDAWHAVGEVCDLLDTPTMCEAIQRRWPDHEIIVYPDASGKNRSTKGASTSDIKIIQNHGFKVRAKDSNPLVKDRVNAMNAALEKGRVRVNARLAPVTARSLEQQAYKDGVPDKSAGFDHQNDATTYPIAYEMPIIRPVARAPGMRSF